MDKKRLIAVVAAVSAFWIFITWLPFRLIFGS